MKTLSADQIKRSSADVYRRCLATNCGCERCLTACDQDATRGMIPQNSIWWRTQTVFPIVRFEDDRRAA
jgi:polyferredoxin